MSRCKIGTIALLAGEISNSCAEILWMSQQKQSESTQRRIEMKVGEIYIFESQLHDLIHRNSFVECCAEDLGEHAPGDKEKAFRNCVF